jgi:hypothetical protein
MRGKRSMTFNPKDHIMNMRGKDYLEVKWRIVWFREENPKGCILTEIVSYDPQVVKATVIDGEANTLAVGHGTPKTQGVAKTRPFEGAETAAIGRALAVAGYGTQFTGEDEGEHLADAPVERSVVQEAKQLSRPYAPETLKDGFSKKFESMQGGAVNQAQTGVMVGRYNNILGGDTERYDVFEYLFGVRSAKRLEPAQVLVGLAHLNGEEAMAKQELIAVRDYLRKQKGQKELI